MPIHHEPFWTQLACAAGLIASTVLIHAVGQDQIQKSLAWTIPVLQKYDPSYWRVPAAILVVLAVLGTIGIEISVWALFFYHFSQEVVLHSMEAALYFSICTFTTVGFGDITLTPKWRLLGSLEAAVGMLIFGWSTAFLFDMKTLFLKR